MLSNLKKLISIAFFFDKKKFYLVILSSFIIISLEFISIAAFIPLFQILIQKEISYPYLNFLNNFDYDTILTTFLFCILGIFLIKNILLVSLEWFSFFYQETLRKKFSSNLFNFYLNHNWLEIVETNSATKIRHIDGEVKNCVAYIFIFIKLINETLICFSLILILAFINFKILLLNSIILIIFGFLYLFLIRKKFIQLNFDRYKLHLSFVKILQDTFRSLKDIKILQKEKKFKNHFDKYNEDYKDVMTRVNVFGILPRYLLETIIVLVLVIIIFILHTSEVNKEEILVTLGVYSIVLFRVFPAANKIINSLQQLTGGSAIISLVYEDFRKAKKEFNIKNEFNKNEIIFNNNIQIKNLNFKYKVKNQNNLLSNIDFEIKKGSSVGVIGPSGSGKSTLVSIFLGLIKQDSGEILVDGKKIDNFDPEWKKMIGFVPQDVNLINDNLLNNITLDLNDNFNEERMNEALNFSQLNDFVKELPEGLNTHLGDFGNKISGGQKQRIGIARAIYKKPSIIVLDESTNSLDTNLEKEIIDNITKIKENYSSIIISHRDTTIEKCDYIYKLTEGKIKQIK